MTLCSLCHKELENERLVTIDILQDGSNRLVCLNCSQILGTCYLCKHKECKFETDENCKLPKIVTQTIRQGNMIQQFQIKNPERIKETCEKDCLCYINNKCIREFCKKCEYFEEEYK